MSISIMCRCTLHLLLILGYCGLASTASAQSKNDQNSTDKTEKSNSKKRSKIENNEQTDSTATLKMTFSPEYASKQSQTIIMNMLRDESGNIHVIKRDDEALFKGKTMYIASYDSLLNELRDEAFDLGKLEGQSVEYTDSWVMGDKSYIRGGYYNKKQRKNMLYLFPIGSKGQIGTPQKVAEYAEMDNCQLVLSPDHSKLLVFKIFYMKAEESNLRVEFTVYDKNLKPIQSSKATFLSGGTWFMVRPTASLRNLIVDNSGRVFVLKDNDRKSVETGEIVYSLDLYQFIDNELVKYDLGLDTKVIMDLKLLETKNPDELVAVGSYTEDKKTNLFNSNAPLQGTFMLRFNVKTETVIQETFKPLSIKLLSFMRVDQQAKEKGAGVGALRLYEAYFTPDSNVVLLFDQNYSVIQNIGSRNSVSNTSIVTYFSQVMLNVKYSKAGKMIYQTYTPKNIYSLENRYGTSHILLPCGEQHVLLFNNPVKNFGKQFNTIKDMDWATVNQSKCVSGLATVDGHGTQTITPFKAGYAISPDAYLNYEKGVLIAVVTKQGNYRLVKIHY